MKLMRTPKQMDISITNRCNLRCKYCYHFESADDTGKDLPASEWISFFEELSRCAVLEVSLAGGEPFIREDLKEIIEGIVKNRMRFSIASNGTLITDEMASFISSTGRCNNVQVSIDGSVPMTHDSMRGRGSFRRASEGIKTLQRHGVPMAVRVTIHRRNVHDLGNVAKFLLEEIGLSSFSTNSANYMGLCRKNAEIIQLTAEERSLAMETLLQLHEKYDGRITGDAGPLAEAFRFAEMERARVSGCDCLPDCGGLTGCNGIFVKMGVRADGTMIPCAQLPAIELGRVNRDRLEDSWLHHPELDRLRKRRQIPLNSFPFCSGCEYADYCTGSCPGLAYTMTGEVNHPAPDACLRKFLEEGGKLPKLEGCA